MLIENLHDTDPEVQLYASLVVIEALKMPARLQRTCRSGATAQAASVPAPGDSHRRAFNLMYFLAIVLHAIFWIGWGLELWRVGAA